MMKGPIWVVASDGGAARFLESEKQGAALVERPDLALHADKPPPPRERPPRVHDRMGPARHIIEPRQTPGAALEERFLESVANAVNAAAEKGAFRSLILCAPPRPLGILRGLLSEVANQRLAQVLAKDYVRSAVDEIEALLRKARLG
jgi:protein required for attachment to host cells